MFSTFSLGARPFDLRATLESWNSAEHPVTVFKGKPKRKEDPTVDAWLQSVEEACAFRCVPKTHWPDVARHFMGKKAQGRVVEVEKIMRCVCGDKWKWDWQGFTQAVSKIGCECIRKGARAESCRVRSSDWRKVPDTRCDADKLCALHREH